MSESCKGRQLIWIRTQIRRMAKNFFKYGLTYIATLLLNCEFQSNIGIIKFLSCS